MSNTIPSDTPKAEGNMAEGSNGNGHTRTIHEWMMHIDNKLTGISDKLDGKADKTSFDKLEEDFDVRITKIEDKTNNLAVKQAGISGTVATLLMLAKNIIIGN